MTLERYIGYTGFFLIFFHAIPFSQTLVSTITIVLSVGLILAATYLRWKKRIQTYMVSQEGHMSIPRFFENLGQKSHSGQYKQLPSKSSKKDNDLSDQEGLE